MRSGLARTAIDLQINIGVDFYSCGFVIYLFLSFFKKSYLRMKQECEFEYLLWNIYIVRGIFYPNLREHYLLFLSFIYCKLLHFLFEQIVVVTSLSFWNVLFYLLGNRKMWVIQINGTKPCSCTQSWYFCLSNFSLETNTLKLAFIF